MLLAVVVVLVASICVAVSSYSLKSPSVKVVLPTPVLPTTNLSIFREGFSQRAAILSSTSRMFGFNGSMRNPSCRALAE